MFAIGINGLDMSSSTRYFDIVMTNVAENNPKGEITPAINTENIVLRPCSVS